MASVKLGLEDAMGKIRGRHITLIGMPAVGKTQVGKRLAPHLERPFVDIDDYLKDNLEVATLQEAADSIDPEEFTAIEQMTALRALENLSCPSVIATGGSIVYCGEAMQRFHDTTYVIYLQASFKRIERKVNENPNRGIIYKPGETLRDLYNRRTPLYKRWAHLTVDAEKDRSEVAKQLAAHLTKNELV